MYLRVSGAMPHEAYFWVTPQSAELALLLIRGNRHNGIQFKRTEDSVVTRLTEIAMKNQRPKKVWVVHRHDMHLRCVKASRRCQCQSSVHMDTSVAQYLELCW